MKWYSEHFHTWLREIEIDLNPYACLVTVLFFNSSFFIRFTLWSQPPSFLCSQSEPYIIPLIAPSTFFSEKEGASFGHHSTLRHVVSAALHTSFLYIIYVLSKTTSMAKHQMEQTADPKPRRSDRVKNRFLPTQPFSFHPFPHCLRVRGSAPEKEQKLDRYDWPHIPAIDPPKSGQLILSKATREIKAQKSELPSKDVELC